MLRIYSVALFVCGFAASAQANPTQHLLRSVPPECSLCLVAQDWKGHGRRIAESPFAERLKKSDLGKTLLNPDALQKIFELEKVLTDSLGLTFEQLRDDILGDAVLYAYRPGPPGKPDEDAGVFLLKAREPKTLAKFVASFNDAQTKSGELKAATEVTSGKLVYTRREKTDGTTEFYFLRDGTFAFSRDERLVRQVLALDAAPPKDAPFHDAYERLGLQKAALAAIFNPRPLDAELKAKIAAAPDDHAKAFLAQFARIWSATRAAAVSVDLGADAELALHAAFDPMALPPELKPFLGSPKASTLWSVIPKDALFAMAGRLDVPEALALGRSFLGDAGSKWLQELLDKTIAPAVGKDALPGLLKGIGPDWGIWIAAPTKSGTLPEVTLALRVRAPGEKDSPLGDALRMGLDFAFQMFRVQYNRTHDDQFALKQIKDEAGAIAHLENAKLLPPGVRPAYAQRGEYFVLASSPEAILRFDAKPHKGDDDAQPYIRIGWAALDRYLKANAEDLAKAMAAVSGKSAADVLKEFREWQQILELLDATEVRRTGTADGAKWSLKLKLAAPLQK